MIKKLLIFIILLVIVGLGGLYIGRNMLAEAAVEEGGNYVLGVETDLGSASLELSGGSFELNNYVIENPEGYNSEYFFELEHGMLSVNAGSVLDETVVVDSLILEGAHLTMEIIDSKANFKELMDHIKSIDMGSESSGSQKFQINKIAMRDIGVDASITIGGKERFNKSLTLDNFELKDVGGDDGITIGEIISLVMNTTIKKASAKAGLPTDLKSQLNNLKDEAVDKVQQEAESNLKDAAKSLLGGDK